MRVALAVNALGLGGTEKGVQTHALAFNRDRVDVRVVAVSSPGSDAPMIASGATSIGASSSSLPARTRRPGASDSWRSSGWEASTSC